MIVKWHVSTTKTSKNDFLRDGLSTPKKEAWDPGLKKFLGVEYLKIK